MLKNKHDISVTPKNIHVDVSVDISGDGKYISDHKERATVENIPDILVNTKNIPVHVSVKMENTCDEVDGLNRIFSVSTENILVDSTNSQGSDKAVRDSNRCIIICLHYVTNKTLRKGIPTVR
jgi:hypothetical protein